MNLIKKKNRYSMLYLLNKSKKYLTNQSLNKIIEFLFNQINNDGGFKDRKGDSDLYYTLFGIMLLAGLNIKINNKTKDYINDFKKIEDFDFIHLTSFINIKKILLISHLPEIAKKLILNNTENKVINLLNNNNDFNNFIKYFNLIENYRSSDNGYNHEIKKSDTGTVYGAYLANMTYESTGLVIKNNDGLIKSILRNKNKNGSFSNSNNEDTGIATSTAAAISILNDFNYDIDKKSIDWLLSCRSNEGGFLLSPNAPMPDLLSTATSLYTLKKIGYPVDDFKNSTVNFIENLWKENGGFCGDLLEETADCEYTFYGLLSLGCLGRD